MGGRKKEDIYVSCRGQKIEMEWGERGGGEKERESVRMGMRDTVSEREREREKMRELG